VSFAVSGVVDEVFSASLPPVQAIGCNGTVVADNLLPCTNISACCPNGNLSNITVPEEFTSSQTMWMNFAFVASGVITGLGIGATVKSPRLFAPVLRTMFALSAAALLLVQLILYLAARSILDKTAVYALVIFIMAVSGAGSLGFIGIVLRVAVNVSQPVDEIYAGGTVEFLLNGLGTVLGELTSVNVATFGFWWFAAPVSIAALAICFIAKFEVPADDVSSPLI
jgi:hypothetical protein